MVQFCLLCRWLRLALKVRRIFVRACAFPFARHMVLYWTEGRRVLLVYYPQLTGKANLLGRAWASLTLAWSTGTCASTDRPTVSVPFTWYRYIACAHAGTPYKAMPRLRLCTHMMVNSAVHIGDSYKTENADNGEAKSWDTCAKNCEAETREKSANLFILALPCRCRHPWLSRMSTFSIVTLRKSFFTLLHKHNMYTQHSGQDLRSRNAYGRA